MLKFALLSVFVLLATLKVQAGVLGDFQTFVPNTDGLYFVTVDSGQVLRKGTFVANGYLSYAKDTLLAYDNFNDWKRIDYHDQLMELDGTFGYSFTDRLQVFLGMTALLYQKPDAHEETQVYLSKGVHSFRPGMKYQLTANPDSRWAVLGSVDILNVTNDPYTGENPSAIPNVELAWSGSYGGKATHGFNLGYRMRNPGEKPSDALFYPLKDQMTFSYGYSYPWSPDLRLVFETIGCYPIDKGQNKRAIDVSCLEFLGAARYRLSTNWAFVGGATVEAPGVQTMSPAWRLFAGINLYILPGKETEPENPPPLAPAATAAADSGDPLQIEPSYLNLLTGQKYALQAKGGTPPYTYTVTEGDSQINHETGIMRAANSPENTRVRATDARGQEVFAEITVKAPEKANKTLILRDVNFIFNSTELVKASKTRLAEAIQKLKALNIREIVVQGHTDDIGSTEYNRDLSERRAQAIAVVIRRQLLLADEQVKAVGFGKDRPVVPNKDEASRLKNRRVELLIYTNKP